MPANGAVVGTAVLMVVVLVTAFVTIAEPLPPQSPYAGQEGRKIKALSSEDVSALEQGEGMGLAKAAELNRYPGPRHVLELAKELELNDAQRERTEHVFSTMHEEAVRLGKQILETERKLDEDFRTGTINEAGLAAMASTLGQLNGQLRASHLRAHLRLRAILTDEQVALYQHLRGYGVQEGGKSPSQGMPQHHHM